MQSCLTLALHARLKDSKRILETACGSGIHQIFLAKTLMQRGSVYVCTDISDEMIRLTKEKFEDPINEYIAIPGNKCFFQPKQILPLAEHSLNIEGIMKDHGIEGSDRFVFGCCANNESLPFKDDSFDCYISNLSLMLVDNHMNMLKEAFRVLRSGATLAFTIWGREENIGSTSILEDVLKKFGILSSTNVT